MSDELPDELDSGVYGIFNLANGKMYVGSAAVTLKGRIRDHRKALRGGYHINRHLQNAWNKYGSASFRFRIIERCPPDDCITREQFWMDFHVSYDPDRGYNMRPVADSNLGVKWSDEAKDNMSAGALRRLECPGEWERLAELGRNVTPIRHRGLWRR